VFYLNLDLSSIADLVSMKPIVEKAMKEAARDLAKMTEDKIKGLARQRLKSRYKLYVDGLSTRQVDEDTWLVILSGKVKWIEDGQESFNMLPWLLKSKKAKTAKDDSKYLTIPFEHGPGKGPTSEGGASGAAEQDLIAAIKSQLKGINKARKANGESPVPFGSLEKDANGAPLIGRLHSFDVTHAPLKTHDGPGQGKGGIGEVRQGPSGTPFLQGVNIYQTPYTDAAGKQRVRRSVVTFRTVSSKQKGLWEHPGNDAVNLMEEGLEWARREWETTISPEILESIVTSLS
jgi:hypothetical protein